MEKSPWLPLASPRMQARSNSKDLQDALGDLNDLATHQNLFAGGGEEPRKTAGASAAGEHLASAEAKAETLLLKAEQAFARFAATKPFWKA